MYADLILALPLGLLGGALFFASLGADDARGRAPQALALAAVLALAIASQWSHALRGFHSDLWMYLTMAGRISEGEWLFDRDPFWLEPPSIRTHSLLWFALGLLERGPGLPADAAVRWVAFLSVVLLTAAAWRLATAVTDDARLRWLLVICFWLSLYPEWAALGLNRNLSRAFALFATAGALGFRGSPRQAATLSGSLAAAFYLHLFGGFLALGGVLLATLARAWRREPLHVRALGLALAGGLVLASPWLWLALPAEGAVLVTEHVRGPGQLEVLGLRVFHPRALALFASPLVLLCAAFALWPGLDLRLGSPGRSFAWIAPAGVGLLLFTPFYHVATAIFGGWMPPRAASLAFLWIPAAASLAALGRAGAPRWRRATAALLCTALFWAGAARVVRDFRDEDLYHPFSAEARAEARALRPLLHRQPYVSSAYLAYGLAAYTLGHPFAVPPGHGSQYHPFGERRREAHRALRRGSPACWARLAATEPDLRFLVTPADPATGEGRQWAEEIGRAAEEVRGELEAAGAAVRVHQGAHFVVDALSLEALGGDPADCDSAA